jgi:hypothetical protein
MRATERWAANPRTISRSQIIAIGDSFGKLSSDLIGFDVELGGGIRLLDEEIVSARRLILKIEDGQNAKGHSAPRYHVNEMTADESRAERAVYAARHRLGIG